MTSPQLPELTEIALELEKYVAAGGWSQPHRLFALAHTADLLAYDPNLRHYLGEAATRSLTPIEQENLPVGPLEQILGTIGWPDEVEGCVLVTELVVLPPSAEEEIPYSDREIDIWATNHPERQDIRVAVAVTRSGKFTSCLRRRADENEVVVDPDIADALFDGLFATFL
ncbi:hypothetical protein I6A84_41440 [Frankia sp. CNm7]|uniref:Uncharacterized protein n=1 Tax=Frankia nepalensis TaxID=1836974 RepID=A0A937RN82_9ACTN|nr:PPA1309 family protein [Frankia nepalensis]MBL7500756.1 hypothetical protein [Frankia nepalensis]MBL7511756.1 hypothetical protein [Frankia nepalensis]MBL7524333.1 hypothetical protein [Frankia nepalensis]MBL7633172.1 hypothetical protein [Frankia nepalensis]